MKVVCAVAVALAAAANDVKGSDIQVLCVKPLIYWARFFVVVTAFSKPQIDAVGYILYCPSPMEEIYFERFFLL
jgi:ribosomal silencing factor RsfS